jgi:hypothetical protein
MLDINQKFVILPARAPVLERRVDKAAMAVAKPLQNAVETTATLSHCNQRHRCKDVVFACFLLGLRWVVVNQKDQMMVLL